LNLYELLKRNSFKGLSISLVKTIAKQLFVSLDTLKKCRIIHCDLKPENILLVNLTRPHVKLIDLGSSCFESKRLYTYIQSRYYRAPEVILGIGYTTFIDIWSLGCVLFELLSGIPLFPGESETDQLLCIIEVLGPPPPHILQQSSKRSIFFDDQGETRQKTNSRGKRRIPGSRSLKNILKGADSEFFTIIESCLKWDPEERIKPEEVLSSEYFSDLPSSEAKNVVKHKKISLEDITRHVPNLQKFIAHRKRLSEA
jgi:dual specificity tyrosine-phosphorylation-regulated kinase 2/3/4